ncbi:MAG: hypothetical protein JST81_15875 [Bacteroidetes bacterium]|nr:hypothetical protein [Bacteroidota bacterium]
MQATDFVSSTPNNPYINEAINTIYNQLFCDNAALYQMNADTSVYPWNILCSNNPAEADLRSVINDNALESRHKIIAYNLLQAKGITIAEKELLGVIVEVALPEGLDVIAAYRDGTARYINYTGKVLVWETETEESNNLVNKLFSDSRNVVTQIGPWDGERLPYPKGEHVRLSFLVSDGLYFGEGPFAVLQSDAMGGPVISDAAALMNFLIDQSFNKN